MILQGLLKVAVDNARVQEKQIQQEKKELKLELFREREMRETLERQLTTEQHNRGWSQMVIKWNVSNSVRIKHSAFSGSELPY